MYRTPSLEDFVRGTLSAMGTPSPSPLIHTLALREGRLVAQKFRYDAGYAICSAGSDVVEFYDQDGKLLKTATMTPAEHEKEKEEAA
jgi:hypothetical protein